LDFKVLGQVELSNGSKSLTLRRSKASQVLSLLVARTNEIVSVDTLIDELWGEQIPRSALTTLQTYVYHLRKMLTHDLRVPEAERVLVTRPPGYSIAVDESTVDVNAFGRLIKEGTQHLVDGDDEFAAGRLVEALNLWRGPAFAGMRTGRVLEAHCTYLNEMRLAAIGLRIEAHQRLGRYWELIPELRSLVAKNPLNEGFHAQLIGALCKCGRRAEALQAYQCLWHVLDSELGVEPAPDIQRLHHEVLVHGRGAHPTFQYSYPTAR
jgi:SARP family transcriptional regulator, regulator of embCAB operon